MTSLSNNNICLGGHLENDSDLCDGDEAVWL